MSTDTTVSSLRHRMIEDMAGRKLGSHSQRSHIESCKRFAAFLKRSPDTGPPTISAAFSCIWPRPASV
jgi:integrase/recombinase XerD